MNRVYSFSDLGGKIANAQQIAVTTVAPHIMGIARAAAENAAINQAVKAVINAHGKFYGSRSKYDGRGNLRQPLKG